MPMALVHAEGNSLLVRASGDITFAEVEHLLEEMDRVVQDLAPSTLLADCRGISSTISAAELRKAAQELQPFISRGLTHYALVTDSTFMYGVGRMFGAFVETTGATLAMFKDVESAQQWLDESRL